MQSVRCPSNRGWYRNLETTTLRFRIMPPLYDLNGAVIEVPTALGMCRVHFVITGSGLSPFQTSGNVQVVGDDLGTMHNTLVEVELPGLPNIVSKIHGRFPAALVVAVDALNQVIENYRWLAKAPQIRRIPYKHARGFDFEQVDATGHGRKGQYRGGNALKPTGEPADVSAADQSFSNAVQARVRGGRVPLWASLFSDALADADAGDIHSSFAHFYMSLEMLINSACYKLGEAAVGRAAVDAFMLPSKGHPPNVYQRRDRILEWAEGDQESKKAFIEKFDTTWKHRNDLLHGRDLKLSEAEFMGVVEGCWWLVSWFQSVKPKPT